MKIIPLALAAALAAGFGSAPPVLAQSTDSGTAQSGSETTAGERQADRDRDGSRNWPGAWQQGYGWMHPGMMGGGGPGWMGQHPWMMGGGAGWMHPGMMGGGPGWMGRGAGSRGAYFRFSRGDARIDIRCPADQKLDDCVNAAGTLIDKVAGMKSDAASATPAQPPGGPGGTPQQR